MVYGLYMEPTANAYVLVEILEILLLLCGKTVREAQQGLGSKLTKQRKYFPL